MNSSVSLTSREEIEVHRFSWPVSIGIPVLAIFLQVFLRVRFLAVLDLPLLVTLLLGLLILAVSAAPLRLPYEGTPRPGGLMPEGRPDQVPADGLTTRQRRNRPLLIIHTGDGKGKSTAAFGLALRGWTQGWSIGVFQFVKSAKWRIGEQTALESLADMHDATGRGGAVEWHKMGAGWSWSRKTGDDDDHAQAAAEGWAEIKRRLLSERHGLYVLDEFTYPINWGWIDVDDVIDTLTSRPGHQHVIITGRRADPRLIEIAQLVTEMTKIKHPFDEGQKGQRGIEW